jgi:chromosome segregation ATPase
MKKSKIIQIALNEAEYAVGGMFKAIADIRANTKKLFALHDKLQSRREHAEDQIDADMQSLHNDRQQLQSDMENDPDVIANVERGDSGPVAEYGEQLDALDDQIAQLMNRKTKWSEKAKAVEDQIRANHKKLGELSGGAMSALRGENMTKSDLKQIIKEELTNVLKEDDYSTTLLQNKDLINKFKAFMFNKYDESDPIWCDQDKLQTFFDVFKDQITKETKPTCD